MNSFMTGRDSLLNRDLEMFNATKVSESASKSTMKLNDLPNEEAYERGASESASRVCNLCISYQPRTVRSTDAHWLCMSNRRKTIGQVNAYRSNT